MRVLRVAQTCYPDVPGGGAYHVHALSRDQAARGHDVTVLTVARDPEAPHLEERAGYTVVRFRPTASLLGNDVPPGLARYLREVDGFDVLHAHSHLYLSTNLAALARRLGAGPLAITNHGLYSQTAPRAAFDAYLRTLGRWTLDQADVVFCYTDVDERRLREVGVRSEVAVVPNGIDTGRFTPDGPTSDRIRGAGPAVLFAGRLVEGKRPTDAVAAVEELREEYPSATLYVCGDGPLRDAVAAAADGPVADRTGTTPGVEPATDSAPRDGDAVGERSPPLADGAGGSTVEAASAAGADRTPAGTDPDAAPSVALLGRVPYDEMPALYRSADALVLPSRAEGLPRTVLEAMASGTPVVTSDLPQIRSVASHGGTTAPPGDVGAFADALDSVLADSPDGGPAHVRADHQWADTVDATTAALERIRRSSPH